MVKRTVISQLASAGEEALGKLAQSPATRNAMQGAMNVKERGREGRAQPRRDGEAARGDREAPRRAREEPRRTTAAHEGRARDESRAARSPTPKTPKRERARRSAPGTISKRAGVVPIGSPSTSTGSGTGGIDGDGRAAEHLDPRVRHVVAAVELRRGRDEVELRDVADQHDVEEPVVGARVRGELHPAAVPAAVRDDHVVHPAAALARRRGVTVTSVFCQRSELADERVEERRAAAERLRHRVRAARDRRRSSRPSRRSRSSASASSPSPAAGRSTRPRSIVRAAPVERDARPRRRSAVGIPWVRPKSCPVPAGRTAISAPEPADRRSRPRSASRRRRRRRADAPSRRPLARELDQVARTLREDRVAAAARAPPRALELRPALARRAVAARRVDEEDGVRSLIGRSARRDVEREPGHPVDRRAQLVVGDAREVALDDDVADRQQAGRLDAADRRRP